MAKRIKVNLKRLLSREEAEGCLNDLAQAMADQRRLRAECDRRKLEVEEEYAEELVACDTLIQERTQSLKAWADCNPQEFGKRKSLVMPSGVIGFRTGTPKLALMNRKWTWAKVLEAVKQTLPAFIREKPEVDKEAILNQRDELAEFLPMVGLKVAQDESFFVEPDLSEEPGRQVAA